MSDEFDGPPYVPRMPAERFAPCDAEWPNGASHQCVLPYGHDVHWDGKEDIWLRVNEVYSAELAAADQRGYERAIEVLRADASRLRVAYLGSAPVMAALAVWRAQFVADVGEHNRSLFSPVEYQLIQALDGPLPSTAWSEGHCIAVYLGRCECESCEGRTVQSEHCIDFIGDRMHECAALEAMDKSAVAASLVKGDSERADCKHFAVDTATQCCVVCGGRVVLVHGKWQTEGDSEQ